MTPAAIVAWHDFFITIAQVGSTLAGLLFVGLTISLGHMLGAGGYPAARSPRSSCNSRRC